jgi:hypothetical protein
MNRRAEMWWYVSEQVLKRNMPYPQDKELRRELSAVRYRVSSSGKLALEPKEKTKEMLLRSPDRADAFVYGISSLQYVNPLRSGDFGDSTIRSCGVSSAVTSAMGA